MATTKRPRDWVYRPVIRVALGLFRLLGFRFTLTGIENVPTEGGAVLACNHVSYLDFMFVGLPAHYNGRRLVRFMAKKSVFDNPIAGPLMRGMHHIPVDRDAGLGAYEAALNALRDGELIGVFPESTISRAYVPRTFKTGAARMAIDSGAPLIPVIVWGGHRVWTSGRKPILRRGVPVLVDVGPPLALPAGISASDATTLLHEVMTQMCEKLQRSYPAPESDAEQWWQPAYLGGAAPTLEEAKPIEAAAVAARAARKEKKKQKKSKSA